jgi:hypothetical protein
MMSAYPIAANFKVGSVPSMAVKANENEGYII